MSSASSVPIGTWLRGYQRTWLAKDVVGGLAAGAVVIPQAMAYATIADLPTQVGLYTCMVPMAVYALLGGSRVLSVSTTSTIAILTGSTLLAASVAANSDDPARALCTLTLLVGLILLIARVLRLGVLIDNISEATLTGIKFGVGLTVAAGQLPNLLGTPSDPNADNFFSEMRAVVDHLDDISGATLLLSAGTIVVLLGLMRLAPQIPAPLIAVIGGILLVRFASLDEHGVALIAPVPNGLPKPIGPTTDGLRELVPGAFAIAIMVFLETLAVARAVRRSDEPPIDNNQELAASGMACAVGSFFRAMPSAGGFSQTAINQRAGARTQLSEFVTVVLAVACALFLGGLLSDLPEATLASLVIIAVLGLIDIGAFVRFWTLDRMAFWIAVLTGVSGLVLGLLAAVLIGVVLTLFLVLVELDRVGLTELQPTVEGDDVLPAGPSTAALPGLLVLRLDGPLYTANVRSVNQKIASTIAERSDIEVLVIDVTAQGQLPVTVIDEVRELERVLGESHVTLWIAGLPPRSRHTAEQLPRWAELQDAGRVHDTSLAAVRRFTIADSLAQTGDPLPQHLGTDDE